MTGHKMPYPGVDTGSPYPHHPHMPPFFAYPPQPDAAHPDQQTPPFMIGLPPGVVYAYPPHPQAPRASTLRRPVPC